MTRPLPVLTAYWSRSENRQQAVNDLFNRSARHYDWICSAMSAGTGQLYRRDALMRVGVSGGAAILDVGTGTGLVAREALPLVGGAGRVIGLDPSAGMMKSGRESGSAVRFVQGGGERLPFAGATFDFVTMGYALRHVPDLDEAFQEYRRVLKPGGRVLLLEVTRPASRLGLALARGYFGSILPLVTRIGTGSRDAARLMRFYWDTIAHCVPALAVVTALEAAGFSDVTRHVEHGILTEYTGTNAH
jgi:demethylmenaquinone methyltransferase / 2-methoxy-6-polyprenyl-1,4-benzoquinol methylase